MSLKIQHSSISTGNLEDWINRSMSHQYEQTNSELMMKESITSSQPTRSTLTLPSIYPSVTSEVSQGPPPRPPPPKTPYPTAPDQVEIDFD